MGKRTVTFAITHSYASDPEPGKVAAALEFWKEALAECVLKMEPAAEIIPQPVSLRIRVRGRRKRAAAGQQTERPR